MYRPIYFLYFVVVLILGWEGYAFCQSFQSSYQAIIHASVTQNLVLSNVANAEAVDGAEPAEIKLMFLGDVMVSRLIGDAMIARNDFKYPFLRVASRTVEADILFVNLETPISSRGKNQGSIYSFRADPRVVEGLLYAGFDVVSVANNHMWDWGREALEDTVDILKKNAIQPVGAGKNETEANAPVFIEKKGTTFAFLGYTNLMPKSMNASGTSPGFSHFDPEKIKVAIQKAQEKADIVIVSLHWGEEYKTAANDLQKSLAHQFIDAGADLIIGHHPHVSQETEQYKDGWIAYSLGNFVFDQNFSKDTRQGLMTLATVKNKKVISFESHLVTFTDDYQPVLAK